LGRLSIVTTIYTEDRLKDFFNLVISVKHQQVIPKMIVVVERNSKLKEQVERILLNNNVPSNVIFSETRLGLAGARNRGALASNTDFVGFVDDDAVLDSHWSQNVVADFDAMEEAVGVTGLTIPRWDNLQDAWFPRPLYWLIGCSDARVVNHRCFVQWASGTNMAFRRSLFKSFLFDERLGGIKPGPQPNFAGDENEFVLRITRRTGQRILFDPSIKVYHKIQHYKISNQYIRKYSLMQGYAEADFRRRYPQNPRNSLRVTLLIGLMADVFKSNRAFIAKRISAITQVMVFAFLGYVLNSLSMGTIVSLSRKGITRQEVNHFSSEKMTNWCGKT
jgi:GT2 family glycosyltransferase